MVKIECIRCEYEGEMVFEEKEIAQNGKKLIMRTVNCPKCGEHISSYTFEQGEENEK